MRPRMSTSRIAGIAVWVWRNCGWIRGPSLLVWPPRWRNEDHNMDPYFLRLYRFLNTYVLFSKWTESLQWIDRCQECNFIWPGYFQSAFFERRNSSVFCTYQLHGSDESHHLANDAIVEGLPCPLENRFCAVLRGLGLWCFETCQTALEKFQCFLL